MDIAIGGDLSITAPGGGTIRVHESDQILLVKASDGPTLWGLLRLAHRLVDTRQMRRFLRLRNPLAQRIEVSIAEELLFSWDAGALPRPGKVGTILRWLRRRR